MDHDDLSETYKRYIGCLNTRDWRNLDVFVGRDVTHNGRPLGLPGYRDMLKKDWTDIPDLHFNIELLVVEAPYVAARLHFDCTPAKRFLGLDVGGRRVSFCENAFYRFRNMKIIEVRSIVDKAAIEDQL